MSINLNFGKGDHVTRFFSNPAKFGEDRISGGAPWWLVVCHLLLFCLFYIPRHAYCT